jgi:hypothetical protein
MLLNRIGGKAVHVPYKGSSQSLVDLAGNQIDMQFDNMTTALAFAKNGQARALAVTSAPLAVARPTCRRSRNRACPASRPRPGSACSRPPARPRPWSAG